MEIICTMCDEELEEPGGLLFGPPDDFGTCTKRHICVACHLRVLEFITES